MKQIQIAEATIPKLEMERILARTAETPLRMFEAREAEILSEEQMIVNIPGKAPVMGYAILAQNTRNPNPLEISVDAKIGDLRQSIEDQMEFLLKRGRITLSGKKESRAEEKLKEKKQLKELPLKDPDCVTIDGVQFKQTGTVTIQLNAGAVIRIK